MRANKSRLWSNWIFSDLKFCKIYKKLWNFGEILVSFGWKRLFVKNFDWKISIEKFLSAVESYFEL